MKEPEGGLLQQHLSLPMSLDAALALLRNPNGENRFSVGVAVDRSGIGGGRLAASVARAFGEVLARAVASAPLRLVGTLVPFGSGGDAPARSWHFAFAPGSTELDGAPAAFEEVRELLDRDRTLVAVLSHELSNEDVERAKRLQAGQTADGSGEVSPAESDRVRYAAAQPVDLDHDLLQTGAGSADQPDVPLRDRVCESQRHAADTRRPAVRSHHQ